MNKSLRFTIFFFLITLGFRSYAQNPEIVGQWSNPIPFDIVPVAVANLPDGRLLTWSSKYHHDFGGGDGFTFTQIFDPSLGLNGAVLPRTVTNTNHDMFCPGINNLADGRILATGGSSSERSSIYDPRTERWIRADDMNIPRGYQGAVTLADGSAFTIGGSWSGGQGNKDAEIWTEDLGWRVLTGLQNELLWNTDDFNSEPQGVYRLDNHAWLWAAPNGKIFHAGPGETMHWLDVSGNGSAQVVGNRGNDILAQNGSTVMFDVGKILKFGGSTTYSQGTASSDNAYVIDINNENNVTVTPTSNNAQEGRIFPSGVALPNGEVLILGGMDTSVPFSDTGAHLSAELFNPNTNSFRTVASMQIPRTYHSTGILLNDGRVFMGGGGLCGGCGNLNHLDGEIYSPPYLFDTNGNLAVRPSLNAPEKAYHERTLPVLASPDVTQFVFMRFSSATHSVNNEQRRVPVAFTGSNGNYQIDMPIANLMPPGYYMLFAINANGVPSISETILVGRADSIIREANLLVEFDFFEGNGSLINDTSGNDNNGEIKELDNDGMPMVHSINYWNADGFLGSAIEMDGMEFNSNSIIEIPTSATIETLTNQISVMAWVNRKTGSVIPQTGNIPNVAIFAHEFPSLFFGYNNSTFQLRFNTTNGSVDCMGGVYSAGEWEHVVGTYDGNLAKLYINGQEICSSPITGNLQINTQVPGDDTFTLAGFYDSRSLPVVPYGNSSGITDELDGSMDKFKLYNIALTLQEIQTIYNNELGDIDIDLEDNLAFNRPTSQSSTGYGGDSFKAVDGNTSGLFDNGNLAGNSVTHTADGDLSAWWRVDLGDAYEYDLTTIRIFNRFDFQDRLIGATVYIGNIDSTNPADYTQVGILTANTEQVLTQNLGIARYVMVRQNNLLSLAEVQVFGNPTNCPEFNTPCDDGDSNTSNDIEDGNCNCLGTEISCDNLSIVYEVNGHRESGETSITVAEGDDIGLFLNLEDVDYTVTEPGGTVLGSNVINDIALGQSGLYSVNSIVNEAPPTPVNPIVLYVSSEEPTGNNRVVNAFDGDANTIWHTEYTNNPDTPHPHEIHLDLGDNSYVSGLQYLPRPAGTGPNGRVANYEIYVSNSTANWGTPISTGTWANNANLKTVNFPVTQARYLRFVALSEVNGNPWASAAEIVVMRPVPTVLYVDSEELNPNNAASNALDGNPNTIWHTAYANVNPDTPYPHEIQIDLGIESSVSGLEYLPRQTGINGTIANYEIYVSNSSVNWGPPVNTGTWPNSNNLKTVNFPKKQGRYVRLLALSEVNGQAWASAAEINIIRTIPKECVKTIEINVETKTIFAYDIDTWTPSNPSGVAISIDDIIVNSGEAVFSSNTICDNLMINPGASLTVNTGVLLTTHMTTLNSTSELFSSIIVDGSISGEVNYNRYTSQLGTNDLISSPLRGQMFGSFASENPNLAASGTIRAFAPYNTSAGAYENYDLMHDVSTMIHEGVGYRAATTDGSTLKFTGEVSTGDILNIPISDASAGNAWNLIGNPFPSYLDFDTFFNLNANQFDNRSAFQAIYGYDGSASNGWTVWNLATIADATIIELITPGQAFFVKSKVGGGLIDFTTSMRRSGSSDDFILGRTTTSNVASYKLNLSSANNNSYTQIYFIDGTTRGLDIGYDAGSYGVSSSGFSIFSNLVTDNTGIDLAIQSLPYADLNDIIVPIGVYSQAGVQLNINIDDVSTIPSNIYVYLEDTIENSFTLLNGSDYIFTPTTNLNGTGRFYLRFASSTLSTENDELDYLQIYNTVNPSALIIKGQLNSATEVSLYDIQGRLVLNKAINHLEAINTIDLSEISTGVYVVKVFNKSQNKTQRIIIK